MKTIKIKELGIEVTTPEEYSGRYKDIKVPKGWKLIEIWQLIYILESKYCNKFLGKFKDKYNHFWCSQTKYAKKNDFACRVGRYRDGDWGAGWYSFDYSYDDGRVVFVRSLEKSRRGEE